jgi:hypothetical protein
MHNKPDIRRAGVEECSAAAPARRTGLSAIIWDFQLRKRVECGHRPRTAPADIVEPLAVPPEVLRAPARVIMQFHPLIERSSGRIIDIRCEAARVLPVKIDKFVPNGCRVGFEFG